MLASALNKRLRQSVRQLTDVLLPPLCPGCDTEIEGHRWLCAACRRRLRSVPDRSLCVLCRLSERAHRGREAGLDCSVGAHAVWRGRAAYWMEPPLDAVIHRMKYGGAPGLARPLASLAARRIPAPAADGITAVPLFSSRRRERGYNQAELLARELAVEWGIPYIADLLSRVRGTRAQAKLEDEDRRRNLAGAFAARESTWMVGRCFVLVDDVVTSGSTLAACLEVFRSAKARSVVPVALALA
jgi:ComF family protein